MSVSCKLLWRTRSTDHGAEELSHTIQQFWEGANSNKPIVVITMLWQKPEAKSLKWSSISNGGWASFQQIQYELRFLLDNYKGTILGYFLNFARTANWFRHIFLRPSLTEVHFNWEGMETNFSRIIKLSPIESLPW